MCMFLCPAHLGMTLVSSCVCLPLDPAPSISSATCVTPAASLQESCARVLLFRGANKDVRNYNSQTAFQVCFQKHGSFQSC